MTTNETENEALQGQSRTNGVLGLRLAIMALQPWLWLTASIGWIMDKLYWHMNEWRFRLEKMVEQIEDKQS